MENQIQLKKIKPAIDRAIKVYIKTREDKIADFVQQHFSFMGSLKMHREVFGYDLIKGPANISWAIPYTVLKAVSSLGAKVGLPPFIEKVPHGFETSVQKEVRWLMYTEFLEIPYEQGERKSVKDALFEEILIQPEIAEILLDYLSQIKNKSQDAAFRSRLETNLRELVGSRTAAADLAGSIFTLAVGATMFKKMTPGAMATGTAVATAIAQKTAISNFVFGSTLGSLYYAVFPATASMGLLIASIGSIMAALSIVSSFSGIVTDPVMAATGLHQRRLKKFLKSIEIELIGQGKTRYELKDRYVARIIDLIDLIKTAATVR